MQASGICLRCQTRLLQRSFNSSSLLKEGFVSLSNDLSSTAPETQNNTLPPNQDVRAHRSAARSLHRTGEGSHTRGDPIRAVLEGLFDANRHRAPATTTSRYSRRQLDYNAASVKTHTGARPEDNAQATDHNQVSQQVNGIRAADVERAAPESLPTSSRTNGSTNHIDSTLYKRRRDSKYNQPVTDTRSRWSSVRNSTNLQRMAESTQGPDTQTSNVKTRVEQRDFPVTGLSLREEVFSEELDRIGQMILSESTSSLEELLQLSRALELPSRNIRLREKLHSLIVAIGRKVVNECADGNNLVSMAAKLPTYLDWYEKHQRILSKSWIKEPLGVFIAHYADTSIASNQNRSTTESQRLLAAASGTLCLFQEYFAAYGREHKPDRVCSGNWRGLPEIESIIIQLSENSALWRDRFHHFLPTIPVEDIHQISSMVALTYSLLHHSSSNLAGQTDLNERGEGFLSIFQHLLHGAKFDIEDMQRHWPSRHIERLLERWTETERHLKIAPFLQNDASEHSSEKDWQLDGESETISNSAAELPQDFFSGTNVQVRTTRSTPSQLQTHKNQTPMKAPSQRKFNVEEMHFRETVLSKDTRKTNELWREFQANMDRQHFSIEELSHKFETFLWGFVDLRKLEPINEVWTKMIEAGVQPNIRHWNAVLEVLRRNRDLTKFKSIWNSMLESGIRPDNECWTIHISILLQSRYQDWHAAMSILDEMGRSWQIAKDEQGNTQPSHEKAQYLPSIVPINATITGLLRINRADVAEAVVQWAQKFSLSLDIATYNIFLQDLSKRGDRAAMEKIVHSMEQEGIEPDVVTKTIILDSALRNPESPLHQLPPAEQEESVMLELERVFQTGRPPPAQTYAVVLQSLLHVPQPNLPAARAVFRLLLRQRTKVPPHIYTILITHYFKSKTPDLAALDSLWGLIEKHQSQVDHVLYDRMIEGYAAIGECSKMLSFFQKMTDAGQVPGWLALERALAALTRSRRWDLCADFVADATSEGGHLHVGKRGWRGEQEFWQLVRELREQKLIPP